MNMKELIAAHARLLREEEFQAAELVLVTASGVIFGTPLFSNDKLLSLEEDAVLEAIEVLPRPGTDELIGDNTFFMLRDVIVHQGGGTVELPFLLLRFDSVIACTLSAP